MKSKFKAGDLITAHQRYQNQKLEYRPIDGTDWISWTHGDPGMILSQTKLLPTIYLVLFGEREVLMHEQYLCLLSEVEE